MKRVVLIFIMFMIILSSCSGPNGGKKAENAVDPVLLKKMTEPNPVHKDELFEMSLNIDKTTFAKGEPIVYSASLTYIGDNESITVWGPRTNVVFYLTDGKKLEMEGANTTELTPTVFVKGEKYEYPFQKSGGYSNDGPDAKFWKEFYGEKDLLLPSGTYYIAAHCDFSLDKLVVDSRYDVSVHTTVTVE
ncbi:hypothetical protein [Paenibacillus sp. LHD-38]|uniref:hypothetical protein n=1 Tax=Paenibacillus sp. LHD-38 TaxID=3072143 RepID=UPI0028102919|nr:hypothetical protein [Paenibacillus sp. LHD-38]MDQ8735876.1 hypothetical protein [Paenibacillus sp. LHD-38]